MITSFFLYIGILPRDGKNIPFKEVAAKIYTTYNFAPSYCLFVSNFAARMLKKNYGTDSFDLAELNLHSDKGGIEYDGSMTRKFPFEYYTHMRLILMLVTPYRPRPRA